MTPLSSLLAEQILGAGAGTDAARACAARALVDTVAVAAAGRDEPAVRAASEWASRATGASGSALAREWRTGSLLLAAEAAFSNGVAAHALDLDDVSMSMWGHPSALLVPVTLALGEVRGATVGDVLDAFAVGLQVDLAVAAGFDLVEHYGRGWHASVTVGTIGAVAAGSRLMRLTAGQTVHALGLAVSMASGSRQNFGTMTKPLHIGFAAANAIRACQLVAAGVDASPDAMDGPLGFYALFGDESAGADAVAEALRRDPMSALGTLNVKRYPCCYQTHRAIDAALDLNGRLSGQTVDGIAEVVVHVNPGSDNSLIHPYATTPSQARFCMRYVVAAALSTGRLDFRSFEPETVLDPVVQDLMRRTHLKSSMQPPYDKCDYSLDYAAVQVHTSDGRTIDTTCTVPRGNADRPLTDAELVAKADACLRHGRAGTTGADLAEVLATTELPAARVVDLMTEDHQAGRPPLKGFS